MKRLLSAIKALTRLPDPQVVAQQELNLARLELLRSISEQEHYTHQTRMLTERVSRLQRALTTPEKV